MSELDLKSRATYPEWVSHTLRYNDQDPLGHINNAVYSTFLEAGRTAFMQPLLDEHGRGRTDIVLARVVIDYLREHWPAIRRELVEGQRTHVRARPVRIQRARGIARDLDNVMIRNGEI